MCLYKITIPGRVPVKKNTAKRFFSGVVYSKVWREWEKKALTIMSSSGSVMQISVYCELHLNFFLKNHQWEPDVSNVCEGPQDVLQKLGILKDDKLIKRLVAEKHFNCDEPRLEIEIHRLKPSLYAI